MEKTRIILIIALIINNCLFLYTQPSLEVVDYDLTQYPSVKAQFFLFDSAGIPISILKQSDFMISDNGINLPIVDLSCSTQNPNLSYSLTISFDLAINNYDTINSNFKLAKQIIKQLINKLDLSASECCLTSFDTKSYLNYDFTNDTAILQYQLSKLKPSKGSSLDTSFFALFAGSFKSASRANYSNNILLVTDGISKLDADRVINQALSQNIKIFVLSISDEISDDLKKVAKQTGGEYFLDVRTAKRINAFQKIFLSLMKNYIPCTLQWAGKITCYDIHSITLEHIPLKISTSFEYVMLNQNKPYLENNPPYLRFSAVMPGMSRVQDFEITARNADITITKLSINHPDFTIVPQTNITSPKTLKVGESHLVSVQFHPQDSAIVFTKLVIESDACNGNEVLITGGFPNTPPKSRTLNLVAPDCGQTLMVGDTAIVEWMGLLPADVIQLEYTVNNGKTWDTLATDITGLRYNWLVPDRVSDSCFVRVIQLWPNNIGQTKDFRHNGGVSSANFNLRDGNKIITSSKDSTARVWDSNSGAILHKLVGHTNIVNWANFDSTETYAVTASDDSTAIIWNLSDGSIKHILRGHRDKVTSANFSLDSKYCVTSSTDGTIKIWDVQTGAEIRTINCGQGKIWHANFDIFGNYILSTGNNDVKMWNAKFGYLVKTFELQNQLLRYATISPDGDKIAAAGWLGKAYVLDINSKDLLYTVTHNDSIMGSRPLNTVNFFRKGDTLWLITAGSDNARIWYGDNGSHRATLIEHTSAVQSAIFNFDGSRVLTASWDSTAKVWNLLKRDLQMDSSDCPFRITKPKLAYNNIDLGRVVLRDIKDTLINPFITNLSDFPFPIKSIKIYGPNANEFEILYGVAPYTINASEKKAIELRFQPKEQGERKAYFEIDIPGQTITFNISAYCYLPQLEIVNEYVDFKEVEIGSFKDTIIATIVRNVGSDDINITKIEQIGPDETHFDILFGDNPLILKAGASHRIELRFTPEDRTRKNSLIQFTFDKEGSPRNSYLFAEGVYPRVDTATLAIASASGSPGDIIEIPIYIKNVSSKGILPSITGFKAELHFNSTMLVPFGVEAQVDNLTEISSVQLNLPAQFGADSILTKIKFIVGLGNDSITPLNLLYSSPIGKGRIVLNEESGVFSLTNFCKEGSNRLFEPNGRLFLSNIAPNPLEMQGKIEYELFESGFTKLYISDLKGNKIKSLFEGYTVPGVKEMFFDMREFAAGTYFLILETPTKHLIRRFEISR